MLPNAAAHGGVAEDAASGIQLIEDTIQDSGSAWEVEPGCNRWFRAGEEEDLRGLDPAHQEAVVGADTGEVPSFQMAH